MKTFIKLQKKDRPDKTIEVPVDHRGKIICDKKGFVHLRHANSAGHTVNIDMLFENYTEATYGLSRNA